MSTVLVTGGCGFLGSHIVDELVKNNYNVCVIDKKIIEHSKAKNINYIKLDLFENDIPNKLFDDCDIIVHLAAFSDLNSALDSPMETVYNNVVLTTKLLEKAVESNIEHFLFASTVYVYSQGGGFYKASKQACEVYIEEFHNFTAFEGIRDSPSQPIGGSDGGGWDNYHTPSRTTPTNGQSGLVIHPIFSMSTFNVHYVFLIYLNVYFQLTFVIFL